MATPRKSQQIVTTRAVQSKPKPKRKVTVQSSRVAIASRVPTSVDTNEQRPTKRTNISKASYPATTSVKSKKAIGTKVIVQSKDIGTDADVSLPLNMSIRARRKAIAFMSMLDADIYASAPKVTQVAAFSFLAVGIAVLGMAFFTPPSGLLASVCDGLTCSVTTAGTTTAVEPIQEQEEAPLVTILPEPSIDIKSAIPEQLVSDISIVFSAETAERVAVSVRSLSSGVTYPFEPELFANQYRVTLSPGQLPRGEYKLRIVARNSTGIRDWTSRSFLVSTQESDRRSQVVSVATTTDDGVPTTTNETGTVSTSSAPTTSEVVSPRRVEVTTPKPLSLSALSMTQEGMIPLSILAPTSTLFIEVYGRRTRALTVEFLGLAERRLTDWVYFIDTKRYPPDMYEVFVVTMKNGTRLRSDSEIISWMPTRSPVQTDVSSNELPLVEERPLVTIRDSAIPTQKPATTSEEIDQFVDISQTTPPQNVDIPVSVTDATSSLPLSVTPVTNQVLALEEQYASEIDSVLKRLAAAYQANNQVLVSVLIKELSELRVNIITAAINDKNLRPFVTTIDEALEVRLNTYVKRVETFERIRSERDGGQMTQDTDLDGISDIDESILFSTDPSQSDTDEDGVSDGVEIARGFNPISAESEAVIVYEDPRTVPVVAPDVLAVSEVTPVFIETPDTSSRIVPEVRGKGIPNSFVTLYIFSEPTIITVRTESDGSFLYRFDRELSDGRHEVYVALTDNSGAVVARSEPFAFVKTAQAFTPVGGTDVPAVTVTPAAERVLVPFAPAVVGTGMLALGLILLALGASLRLRPPQVAPTSPS